MTQKVVVISGPANTGKMPLARKLAADHPEYKIVHRDDLRRMFVNEVDEGAITLTMYEVAKLLLGNGHTPLLVAWNLEPVDRALWANLSRLFEVPLEWLDITRPEVAAMIPPMEPAPAPVQREVGEPEMVKSDDCPRCGGLGYHTRNELAEHPDDVGRMYRCTRCHGGGKEAPPVSREGGE